MADGETIDVKGGTYRIKRIGDHYYCTSVSITPNILEVELVLKVEIIRITDAAFVIPVKSKRKYFYSISMSYYYFRCMAWKNQNRPVDSRTCKHLKEHLGEKFEKVRCDLGADGATSSGRVSRPPAKAKVIPQLLLANKWTER